MIKNLLRDCEYRAFLKARRRMLVQEVTDPVHLDRAVESDDSAVDPMITIVELLSLARAAGMSDDDIDLGALADRRTDHSTRDGRVEG